jgi:hypothetical protein
MRQQDIRDLAQRFFVNEIYNVLFYDDMRLWLEPQETLSL